MRAARLDRKIVIEKATETLNSSKEVIKSWATWQTVWAKKTDTGGSEKFNSAVIASMTTNFEIRYLRSLTEKMRIKYDGGVYSILGIVEIGRHEGLLIKTEKQDHGYND
jgi:SPP1 family predicted phage head-tail adaptor